MRNHSIGKKTSRILLVLTILAALLVADVILWSAHISALTPYAITDGEDVVCCVKGKSAARDVLNNVFTDLVKDNTTISAISSDYHVEKKSAGTETVTPEEAYDAVLESAGEKDAEIRIVSTRTETESYTPEPDYHLNDTMFAGESEIISEGEDGEKKVAATYTTVNGRTEDRNTADMEILEEGVPAVIEKGELGLPSGEEWTTYEGDPVANDGNDIMTTARQYVGLRYVWGGKSLETGVDCSGFVIAIYRKYGVNLNYPLYKEGTGVSYSEAQPGDVLYFPGHYGLYLGDGMMVHASNRRTGVIVSNVGNRKILAVRRIVDKNQ